MAEGDGLVKRLWTAQERRVALWSPVMIGLGVWLRLAGGVGVPLLVVIALLVLAAAGFVIWRRRGVAAGAFGCAVIALMATGHLAASVRIAAVDAPVLESGFRGQVMGRIVQADRSRSDAPRVVLDRLALVGVHPSAVPERVRITLVDRAEAPEIGAIVSMKAILGPPAGPAAPGAFDFSRQAFFRRIGAVGYARGQVAVEGIADGGGWLWLAGVRHRIARDLRRQIGGDEGAVAAALIVGDRSGISDETTQSLRDSGLAHLLAISGLHIGLMSALTFWLVRAALALMPVFASHYPIRKIAAVAGLCAAAGYLALAGFGVATQRAFIMAAVAFAAILLDRRALTARGLAAAACLVLLLRPESLFEAGFQMSFAAVAALVAGYEFTQPYWLRRAERRGFWQRLYTGFVATLATSVMAGTATAPFAAYHFNRLVAYGLPANVLATPVMGLWIMPAIILTAVLAPFGMAGVGLAVLGWGIGYILWVAAWVGGLEGAALSVHAGTPLALALIVFGGLWLVIWRGGLRAAGIVSIFAGFLLWREAGQPDLLIAQDAKMIAARTTDGGLWVSRKKNSGYAAETWLRRSGQSDVAQEDAYTRRRWSCSRARCEGVLADGSPVVLIRNRSRRAMKAQCVLGAVVIAPKIFARQGEARPCTLIDRHALSGVSSIAVTLDDGDAPLIEAATPARLGHQYRRSRATSLP